MFVILLLVLMICCTTSGSNKLINGFFKVVTYRVLVGCFLLFHMVLFPAQVYSQMNDLSGAWEIIQTEKDPIARHENGFVGVGNKLYLIGGRGLKPISIYDVKRNIWSEGAKPPVEIHHFQAIPYNGHIYVIGAMTGKYPYEKPISNILIYNPKEDIWYEGAKIPEHRRRGSAGVVIYKDKAIVVSGIVDGHNSNHVPWVDSYDFKTKKWEVLADAPRPRDHFHAIIKDGKVYALGGRNSSYATGQTFQLTVPEIDVYNIAKNTWETLSTRANLKIERAGAASIVFKDYLILIGGESVSQKKAHSEVSAFNTETASWMYLDSLTIGRHGTQAVLLDQCIYIVAGSGNRGGKPELSSLEKLDLNDKFSK
ncbi:Kelch repeat-containing protein [Cognatitamlana onchidii]|uniref:Kelch repeat-containing protein n=1 Tax=Cognatitamlana onchidii TaxID=2562860 RepID=UPI001F18CBEA|nr:kelch repeat-containing protein [Algibacter onchidii]